MKTVMHDGRVTLYQGDSRDILKELPDNSIDSCVCDPPYALVSIQKRFGKPGSAPAKGNDAYMRASSGFMGANWDVGDTAFAETFWAEVLRVLKPGGHVVAFSGTRTYHRMAVAIEDAGFECRDMLSWVYGSGFPKSHNQHGDWEGWGTALKPAHEPICLARKPLCGTVAANLASWGVGALNVDGCRVATGETIVATRNIALGSSGAGVFGAATVPGVYEQKEGGRWPANICHDGSDEVLAAFPETKSGGAPTSGDRNGEVFGAFAARSLTNHGASEGSAARFFYCAKASRADRDAGLDHLPKKAGGMVSNTSGQHMTRRDEGYNPEPRANIHPTVKPTTLMQWLCRLITPPGGVILDPFMGSGSTGKAAVLEGFQFVGCEREDEYMPIATARIAWAIGASEKYVVANAAVLANDNRPADLFSEAA